MSRAPEPAEYPGARTPWVRAVLGGFSSHPKTRGFQVQPNLSRVFPARVVPAGYIPDF